MPFRGRPSTPPSTTPTAPSPTSPNSTSAPSRSTGLPSCGPITAWPFRCSPRPSRGSTSRPTWPSAHPAAGPTEPRPRGRKVVYCHTPARWLYQPDRYLAGQSTVVGRRAVAAWPPRSDGGTAGPRPPPTGTWSTPTPSASGCRDLYGIDAEVVPPPVDVDPPGRSGGRPRHRARVRPLRVEAAPVQERRSGHRRLRAAPGPAPGGGGERAAGRPDHLDLPTECDRARPGQRRQPPVAVRVVVRTGGRLLRGLRSDPGRSGVVRQAHRRAAMGWLPRHHGGGDAPGCSSTSPTPRLIADAVDRLSTTAWAKDSLTAHARQFSMHRFVKRMQAVVAEERALDRRGSPTVPSVPAPAGAGGRDQEAPRPRKMVLGVCQRICMSHQNDHEAT